LANHLGEFAHNPFNQCFFLGCLFNLLASSGWLTGLMVCLLIGCFGLLLGILLVRCLVGYFVDLLVDWLAGRLVCWLAG
jgi:hypothetical protein